MSLFIFQNILNFTCDLSSVFISQQWSVQLHLTDLGPKEPRLHLIIICPYFPFTFLVLVARFPPRGPCSQVAFPSLCLSSHVSYITNAALLLPSYRLSWRLDLIFLNVSTLACIELPFSEFELHF